MFIFMKTKFGIFLLFALVLHSSNVYYHLCAFLHVCLVCVFGIGHMAASETRSISMLSHITNSSTGPWMTDQIDQVLHTFKCKYIVAKRHLI